MSKYLDLSKLSPMDALDLAILIENEACQRYQMFASELQRNDNYDARAFFATMAKNEAKHGQQLEARRLTLFGDAPARLTRDKSLVDILVDFRLFDIEAPNVTAAHRGMSTLQAFEVGLVAEKMAHDFYEGALSGVTDLEVRALFTELRDEETEHVDMLREEMAKLPSNAS